MFFVTISWNLVVTHLLRDEWDGQTDGLEIKSDSVSLGPARNKTFRFFMFQWVTLKGRICFCSVLVWGNQVGHQETSIRTATTVLCCCQTVLNFTQWGFWGRRGRRKTPIEVQAFAAVICIFNDIHLATSGNVWPASHWYCSYFNELHRPDPKQTTNQICVFLFLLKGSERCRIGPCKKKKWN